MKEKVDFQYNSEIGYSYFQITYKGITFCSGAQCHPDDLDFASEKTGLQIAEIRANIKVLQYKRDTELIPQQKILKHLLNNIQSSSHHNPKSYESIMIRNQLKTINKEIDDINNSIKDEKLYLKDYINQKERLYNRLRAKNNNL